MAEEQQDTDIADEVGWFSVWAQPPACGELTAELNSAMARLRTQYAGPYFDPHVTIQGLTHESGRTTAQRLRAACRNIPPFTVRLTKPQLGKMFYQCIYMLVDPTPQVLHAHKHVAKLFEDPNAKDTGYMPHLSLLYGDLNPEEREKAKDLVETEFPHILETEFLVSSLCLYDTDVDDKSLASWKKVAEYPLEGTAAI